MSDRTSHLAGFPDDCKSGKEVGAVSREVREDRVINPCDGCPGTGVIGGVCDDTGCEYWEANWKFSQEPPATMNMSPRPISLVGGTMQIASDEVRTMQGTAG